VRTYQKAIPPADFPPALRARLARVGGPNLADRFRREAIFTAYRPKIGESLAADYLHVAGEANRWYHVPCEVAAARTRVANSWSDAQAHLRGLDGELQRAHLGRAFDEESIRDYAENYSRTCSKMHSREHREDFVISLGIDPPSGRSITAGGACARMDDPQWWRRQLRRAWTRRAENVMREIGIVRKGREPYASDDAVTARAQMKAKGKKFLETHEAINEVGEQLSLFRLAEHSLANPALRRGEFMCRVRGFEEIARQAGHVAMFWTLTAPSAFHAQLAAGVKNPNYIRAAVRDAQAWLCKQWAKVRAKLKRLSILLYGFRIAEPHHDATPHWHLLLFARPRDSDAIEFVIREYWVRNDKRYADEKGAASYRTKLEIIDSSKGSATGYVAKYVSKNIDGAGAIGDSDDTETGGRIRDGIRRVDAWASLHGIRQFQQIGGPPIGLWRELRRLTEVSSNSEIERARGAADSGNWADFISALDFRGVAAGRRVGLQLAREQTGELTKYAEERPAPVVGVRFCSVVEITRPHSWRIQRCTNTISTTAAGSGSACVARERSDQHRRNGLVGLGLGAHREPKRKGRSGRTRNTAPCQGAGMTTGAAGLSGSFSSSFSDLGPVAITVRKRVCGLCGADCRRGDGHRCKPKKMRSTSGTSPGFHPGEAGSTPARIAIPFFEWESTLRAFERERDRYPTAKETIELWNHPRK
jgi:hypothetical protein